ncbi:hypothetical protein GCM10010252_04910 [Streptomyces aureoverticillatus]|nr:hypothetical protein GCM10010252_04910 [Streptomyces aureoverticillatus]
MRGERPPHRLPFSTPRICRYSVSTDTSCALENGDKYHWSRITDSLSVFGLHIGIPVSVYGVLGIGVLCAALFVAWEAKNKHEPLVPLGIVKVRTFSAANIAIVAAGFAITAASFPGTLYFQVGRGMTPAQAALMMLPSALVSVPLAPQIGKDMNLAVLLAHAAWMGASSSLMMSPLAVAAMQSLPPKYIGAGSGLFDTAAPGAGADERAGTGCRRGPTGAGPVGRCPAQAHNRRAAEGRTRQNREGQGLGSVQPGRFRSILLPAPTHGTMV